MQEPMYKVGKIVNTHGIKGEVRVFRMTDIEDRFKVGNKLYIDLKGQTKSLIIDRHRKHKEYDLLHFEGLNHIEDVEPFKNKYLKITKNQLATLDEGQFYFHEIIGCEVWTTTDEKIGIIDHILSPGANDVFVAKQNDGKEVLIPHIKDVVKRVCVEQKIVIIEPMEGLLE